MLNYLTFYAIIFQGDIGPQGNMGYQGPNGVKGARGPMGATGSKGTAVSVFYVVCQRRQGLGQK